MLLRPPFLESGFLKPLLVEIHDGPDSMWKPSDPSIWPELQFLVTCGYGIVFGNPPGSDGYGRTFLRANFQNG